MSERYFDDWSTAGTGRIDDGLRGFYAMIEDFGATDEQIEDEHVIFAAYGREGYDGFAFVLFEQDGKLYEVNASHCSCYGLGGQWKPEETTWAEVQMRDWRLSEETNDAFATLVAKRAKVAR